MAVTSRPLFLFVILLILGGSTPVVAAPAAQDGGVPGTGSTNPPVVYRYTLPNGLRIWCQPRTESRSVTVQIVLAAGPRNETPANNGISHFVEHMLFTGTTHRSEDEILNAIDNRGGRWNGMTNQDRSTYYAQVAGEDFDFALDWLADLVFSATLPEDKLECERKIIFRERWGHYGWLLNLLDSWGFGYDLDREVRRQLFPDSALSLRIMGEDASLDRLTRADLLAYYAERYVPANAVLVVSGYVSPQHVLDRATALMGNLPARPRPADPAPAEPAPAGPYRMVVRGPMPTEQMRLMLGARTIAKAHPDRWPLEVLGAVLSKDLDDRVRQREGWVYNISAFNSSYSDGGYFIITTSSAPEQRDAIIRLAGEQIESIRRGELPAERVDEVKARLLGQWALDMESNEAGAGWLASWATVLKGDEAIPDYAAAIDAVTPDDLQRVVRTYFTPENSYLARHEPIITIPGASRIALVLAGLVIAGVVVWRWRTRRLNRVRGQSLQDPH